MMFINNLEMRQDQPMGMDRMQPSVGMASSWTQFRGGVSSGQLQGSRTVRTEITSQQVTQIAGRIPSKRGYSASADPRSFGCHGPPRAKMPRPTHGSSSSGHHTSISVTQRSAYFSGAPMSGSLTQASSTLIQSYYPFDPVHGYESAMIAGQTWTQNVWQSSPVACPVNQGEARELLQNPSFAVARFESTPQIPTVARICQPSDPLRDAGEDPTPVLPLSGSKSELHGSRKQTKYPYVPRAPHHYVLFTGSSSRATLSRIPTSLTSRTTPHSAERTANQAVAQNFNPPAMRAHAEGIQNVAHDFIPAMSARGSPYAPVAQAAYDFDLSPSTGMVSALSAAQYLPRSSVSVHGGRRINSAVPPHTHYSAPALSPDQTPHPVAPQSSPRSGALGSAQQAPMSTRPDASLITQPHPAQADPRGPIASSGAWIPGSQTLSSASYPGTAYSVNPGTAGEMVTPNVFDCFDASSNIEPTCSPSVSRAIYSSSSSMIGTSESSEGTLVKTVANCAQPSIDSRSAGGEANSNSLPDADTDSGTRTEETTSSPSSLADCYLPTSPLGNSIVPPSMLPDATSGDEWPCVPSYEACFQALSGNSIEDSIWDALKDEVGELFSSATNECVFKGVT